MLFSSVWKGCLIVGSLILAALSGVGFIKWKHDNKWEEMAEVIIEQQTNLKIDLSPASPDPDQIERARKFLDKHKLDMVITSPSSGDYEIAGI